MKIKLILCPNCKSDDVYEFGIIRNGDTGTETITYDCPACHKRHTRDEKGNII